MSHSLKKEFTGTHDYGSAIRIGFEYLLSEYPEVFTIGQGLWAPWYVGNSMRDLDKNFGKERVIDSPVSEVACTGAALGAALAGYKPIVIHPRMDFMILAIDQIVNQAAKWSHMFGGQVRVPLTIRGIINRGGEQGAQHSQALHSWFAHIPGLRVVMPSTAQDARDLLIASVLSPDPVLYIDDRWLYDEHDDLGEIQEMSLEEVTPLVTQSGSDVTIVGAGYGSLLARQAGAAMTQSHQVSCEVIDLRTLNPFDVTPLIRSVEKTGRLVCVDGGWQSCGMASEIIASVVTELNPGVLLSKPERVTLADSPAPTSGTLEKLYYPNENSVKEAILRVLGLGEKQNLASKIEKSSVSNSAVSNATVKLPVDAHEEDRVQSKKNVT